MDAVCVLLDCALGFFPLFRCNTHRQIIYIYIDRLRVAKQFLSCALVRGRGVVFRHYYKSIAKCAGKDYRDGAVVPFE